MLEAIKEMLTKWIEIPAGVVARDVVAVAGIALAATQFYYVTTFVLRLVES